MKFFFLLGLYTARLELFKLMFFIVFGLFLWSIYLVYDASGSSTRKRRKKRAILIMSIAFIALMAMSVTWLLSKTNVGWWFDR
ncbi:MAG: hypothetical protein U0T11_07665 [Chitinophagaceae bacterium]